MSGETSSQIQLKTLDKVKSTLPIEIVVTKNCMSFFHFRYGIIYKKLIANKKGMEQADLQLWQNGNILYVVIQNCQMVLL